MSAVSLENVSKVYSPRQRGWQKLLGRTPAPGFQALDHVSLNIEHGEFFGLLGPCLLYTSPSPRDQRGSRMPSSA